jgi:phenylalanyl-tRNA synthetase beta chain
VVEEKGDGEIMPVLSISAQDLRSLLMRKVSDPELREVLPLNKMEIDFWEGDEIRVEITPDRPDLYSVEGIARQLNGWLGLKKGPQEKTLSKHRIDMRADKSTSRPYIVAGVVRGLEMNDYLIKSLMQLQDLIDLSLGRDRRKVAIGVHNLDVIKPPLHYKDVSPSEISFIPLNSSEEMNLSQVLEKHPKGIDYKHLLSKYRKYPVIMDTEGVVSFPPVINSERTRVTEKTKNLFFDLTGTDKTAINYSLNIMMTALAMRGGKMEAVRINNTKTPHLNPRPVKMDIELTKRLLGLNLKDKEIKTLLERMCYGVNLKKDIVYVPPYRFDILHPVDIIEDIAIAYGYNNFEPEIPSHSTVGSSLPIEEYSNTIRQVMVGLGFQETINYTLTSKEKLTNKTGTNPAVIEISNPVTSEYSVCRDRLLPSLLQNLVSNKHRRFPQKMFEVSDVVIPDEGAETNARNNRNLAAAVSHSSTGLSDILSILNALKENISLSWKLTPTKHPTFIPGRCASIVLGRRAIGLVGEVHPRVLESFDIKTPVSAFELDVEAIL